jgi:sugar diacid utilization regulator
VTDASGNLLNMACYPRSLDLDATEVVHGGKYAAHREIRTIRTTTGSRLNVYIVTPDVSINTDVSVNTDDADAAIHVPAKASVNVSVGADGSINPDDAAQIADVLRMSVNMWSQNHTEMVLPELVKAILQDEPIKMRRIAAAFNIDIASIHSMLLITPVDGGITVFDKAVSILKTELAAICKTIVADIYNTDIVAFIDTPTHSDLPSAAEALGEALEQEGVSAVVTLCLHLSDTAQVRRVYLTIQNALATTRLIYPSRNVFTLHDVTFADECRLILERGEQVVRANISPLDCLDTGDPIFSADLLETLTVFLLDSDGNMRDCAERLYIHLNSVKYRIKRAGERLGFKIGHLPETLEVYRGLALRRLLIVQKDNHSPFKIS